MLADLFFQNLAFDGSLGIVGRLRLDIFFLTDSWKVKRNFFLLRIFFGYVGPMSLNFCQKKIESMHYGLCKARFWSMNFFIFSKKFVFVFLFLEAITLTILFYIWILDRQYNLSGHDGGLQFPISAWFNQRSGLVSLMQQELLTNRRQLKRFVFFRWRRPHTSSVVVLFLRLP